jgi:hypothetical protein
VRGIRQRRTRRGLSHHAAPPIGCACRERTEVPHHAQCMKPASTAQRFRAPRPRMTAPHCVRRCRTARCGAPIPAPAHPRCHAHPRASTDPGCSSHRVPNRALWDAVGARVRPPHRIPRARQRIPLLPSGVLAPGAVRALSPCCLRRSPTRSPAGMNALTSRSRVPNRTFVGVLLGAPVRPPHPYTSARTNLLGSGVRASGALPRVVGPVLAASGRPLGPPKGKAYASRIGSIRCRCRHHPLVAPPPAAVY